MAKPEVTSSEPAKPAEPVKAEPVKAERVTISPRAAELLQRKETRDQYAGLKIVAVVRVAGQRSGKRAVVEGPKVQIDKLIADAMKAG